MAELSPPGVKSTRAWVGHDQRDTRDPPGPRAGHGEARSVRCDCGGGFGRRRLPARAWLHSAGLKLGSGSVHVTKA